MSVCSSPVQQYSAAQLKLTAAVHSGTCSHWLLGRVHLFFFIMKMFLICCHYNISRYNQRLNSFLHVSTIRLSQCEKSTQSVMSRAVLQHITCSHTLVLQVLKCFWMHLVCLSSLTWGLWAWTCVMTMRFAISTKRWLEAEVGKLLSPITSVWMPQKKRWVYMHRSTYTVGRPLTTALMSPTVDVILVCKCRQFFYWSSCNRVCSCKKCVLRGCGRHPSPCPLTCSLWKVLIYLICLFFLLQITDQLF